MFAAEQIAAALKHISRSQGRPVVVALDGGSGAGKTTLARQVQSLTGAAIIHLDDFYTTIVPEHKWPERSIEQRLQGVFDWQRVRWDALEPLRADRPARWFAFDFVAGLTPNGTYGLRNEATEMKPAPILLLEGFYSASPPLTDLIDLAVLIQVSADERSRRTDLRDETDFLNRWHAIWDEVEAYYFSQVRPPKSFDLVVTNEFLDTVPNPAA